MWVIKSWGRYLSAQRKWVSRKDAALFTLLEADMIIRMLHNNGQNAVVQMA